MSAIWSVSKALQIPLDKSLKTLPDIPYTISYVIRKRQQIDGFNELPSEKRPPEIMIWQGSPEDIDDWLSEVFKLNSNDDKVTININEIE